MEKSDVNVNFKNIYIYSKLKHFLNFDVTYFSCYEVLELAKDKFRERFVMTEVSVSSMSMELSQLLYNHPLTREDPVPRA